MDGRRICCSASGYLRNGLPSCLPPLWQIFICVDTAGSHWQWDGGGAKLKALSPVKCPLPGEYCTSHAQLWKSLGRDFDDDDDDDDAFMTRAVAWLGGAVRIPYVFLRHFVL